MKTPDTDKGSPNGLPRQSSTLLSTFSYKFNYLTFNYPDTFDRRRNEARMEKIRKEINPFLSDPSWEVLACDEFRLELEALARHAGLKHGARTILKVNRERESQSDIGFLNQTSFVPSL